MSQTLCRPRGIPSSPLGITIHTPHHTTNALHMMSVPRLFTARGVSRSTLVPPSATADDDTFVVTTPLYYVNAGTLVQGRHGGGGTHATLYNSYLLHDLSVLCILLWVF